MSVFSQTLRASSLFFLVPIVFSCYLFISSIRIHFLKETDISRYVDTQIIERKEREEEKESNTGIKRHL